MMGRDRICSALQRRLQDAYMRGHVAILAALALISALASAYLHYPGAQVPLPGLNYSDVVYGVFSPRFILGYPDFWIRAGALEELRGGRRACPAPYLDYKFEYPPAVAALFYASTCAAIHAAFPKAYPPDDYWSFIVAAARIHYAVQALALVVSYIAMLAATYLVARSINAEPWRLLLIPVLPSTTVYMVYNWDVVAAAFFMWGVYLYLKGRQGPAGALIGLSVSTKLLTAVAGAALALRLLGAGKWRGFAAYTSAFTLFSAAPYALIYVLSPRGFMEFINHHAHWYCENCLYMPLVPDIWSPAHKILGASAVAAASAAVLAVALLKPRARLQEVLFASAAAPIIFNYVFTPQMLLMITPAAALALSRRELAAYALADAANALLIVIFFHELGAGGSPWTLEGTTQKIALARNLTLLALWIRVANKAIREP